MPSRVGSFVHKARGLAPLLVATLIACSPSRELPIVSHPPIDYERCRDVPLKLNNLTGESTRKLVRCLNSGGTLKPIEDWMTHAPARDLESAFTLWNQVVGANQTRFENALSVLSRWNAEKVNGKTHIDVLFEQLAAVIDSGFADAAVQLVRVLDRRSRAASMNESFLVHLLKEVGAARKRMAPLNGESHLRTLALLTDNNVARFAAQKLSTQVTLQSRSQTDEDLSATISFQKAIRLLEDLYQGGKLPAVWSRVAQHSTLKALPTQADEAFQLEGLFAMLTDPEDHGQRLGVLRRLVADFDRPMKCFLPPTSGEKGLGLQIRNVFDLIVREKVTRRLQPEGLTQFLLRDLNLLVGLAHECEIDEKTRASLVEGAQYFQNMTFMGHATGHAQLLHLFQNAGRLEDLKDLLRSEEILRLAPILAFLSQRGVLAPTLLQVGRFVTPEDYVRVADFIGHVARGMKSPEWIFQFGRESRASESARALDQFFEAGFRFVTESDTGIGPLLAALARADGVSAETPFVDAIDEILSREDAIRSVVEFYPGLVDAPQFVSALRHLGKMAATGELKKLVNFLVELHRASGRDQLLSQRSERGYGTPAPINLSETAKPLDSSQWLTTVESCQGVRSGLRTGAGVESGLKCLSADGKMAPLGNLAGLLKRRDLLDVTADWVQRGLFDRAHISGSVATLRSWEQRRLFNEIMSSSNSADRFAFLRNLEFFLSGPETLGTNVRKTLSCVGASLSDSKVVAEVFKWVATFVDQKEDVWLRLTPDYRLRIHDEKNLREQMKQFPELMAMPADVREKQFQLAMNEFRERSPAYSYRQKTYPRYTTEEMKDELENYVKAFLNLTNLDELIEALGELSRAKDPGAQGPMAGLDVAQVIDQIVGVQRLIPFYPGPGEAPQVRVVTPADQLEILVMNVDVDMAKWVPIVGAENMGIFYIWNVAESKNLPFTLSLMKKAMQAGHLYTRFQERQKHFFLENDMINFYVLEQMAADGSLRLFQRIYQALYRSTPEALRRSQDKNKNQIYLAHWPMKYGLMMRLVPILAELRERGQLKDLVRGLFALGRIFKRSDAPVVREILKKFLFQEVKGKSLLRHLFDHVSRADEMGRGPLVASRFFQLLSTGLRLGTEVPGGAIVFNQVLGSPDLALKLVDLVAGDIADPEFSYLGHLGAGVHKASDSLLFAIRKTAERWLRLSGGECAEGTVDFLLKARNRDRERADRFIARFTEDFRGTTEQRARLARVLRIFEETTRSAPGLNLHLAKILKDPSLSEPLVKIVHAASTEGLLAPLIHELFLPSGENGINGPSRLQELIQFINRVFEDIPSGVAASVPVP